jgi:hypothetical protein
MEKLNKIKKERRRTGKQQQEKQACRYCSALTQIQAMVVCATRYTSYQATQRKGLDSDKGQRGARESNKDACERKTKERWIGIGNSAFT